MPNKADIATTLGGGGAGLMLLATVDWAAIPNGEIVKLGAAFALILIGALLYRGKKGDPERLTPEEVDAALKRIEPK